MKKAGFGFGALPTSAGKNKTKEIKESSIEMEEVDEPPKPVKKQVKHPNDPVSASLLQPIKNKSRRIVPKGDGVYIPGFTRASPSGDREQ